LFKKEHTGFITIFTASIINCESYKKVCLRANLQLLNIPLTKAALFSSKLNHQCIKALTFHQLIFKPNTVLLAKISR
jgi:hypothetical protein